MTVFVLLMSVTIAVTTVTAVIVCRTRSVEPEPVEPEPPVPRVEYKTIGGLIDKLTEIDSWPIGSFPSYRVLAAQEIVEGGHASLPDLIQGLGDQRKTKLTFSTAGEAGTRSVRGIDLDLPYIHRDNRVPHSSLKFEPWPTKSYEVRVADICAFLVGEIVERPYGPELLPLSGRVKLFAPLRNPKFVEHLRKDWQNLTKEAFLESLANDSLFIWWNYHSGMRRLWFFDPKYAEQVVVKLLRRYYVNDETCLSTIEHASSSDEHTVRNAKDFIANSLEFREATQLLLLRKLVSESDENHRKKYAAAARALLKPGMDWPWKHAPLNDLADIISLLRSFTPVIDREYTSACERIFAEKERFEESRMDGLAIACHSYRVTSGLPTPKVVIEYHEHKLKGDLTEKERASWQRNLNDLR